MKNIAIAIPGNIAITKRVKFSKDLDELAISEEVLIEANQFIPFSLDDVHIDWVTLGNHPQSPETDNEVLICASRRDRITDYMAVAEGAELKVVKVDIDTFSKQIAFESVFLQSHEMQNEVIAVIDAGKSTLHIAIYNKSLDVAYTKEVSFGSNQLTDSVCNAYGITTEQAEDAKRRNGQGLTNYHTTVLNPFLESLGMEINRTLQFFLTQATVEKIDRIIISGGCGSFEGAADIIGNATQIKTETSNPFEHMQLSSKIKNKNLATEAPLLATACGLALRRFDF